jgi:choline dehydrogenase
VLVERLISRTARRRRALRQGGDLVEARAKGEVILCAGSIGSTQVLQRSGIGPGRLARRRSASTSCSTAGRRAQPAGPSAAARDLQGRGRRTLNETYYSLFGAA